jgi:NAD(P)-dependent dehydrogenase (short-subunit alcohol dehydrogenase family)
MAGRLEGKVAAITGGVSGIGLGTVELFVAEGAKVVAADIQDEKGAMLEKRFPGQVVYARCDVTSEAEIEAALSRAKSEFGGLDILFNNAGISDRMTSITEVTAEGWSWIYDILVRGPALGMLGSHRLLLRQGRGDPYEPGGGRPALAAEDPRERHLPRPDRHLDLRRLARAAAGRRRPDGRARG